MTTELEELAPIDWLVVEFVGSSFNRDIVPSVEELVRHRVVRVLDLVLLRKRADGSLETLEVSELDQAKRQWLVPRETELAMLLGEDDVAAVASAVEPGSTAACLVWENLWAAPFTAAVRRAGGQLVAGGRIPVAPLLAAVEDDLVRVEREGGEAGMPLSRQRARQRAAILGPAPLARTAVTEGTAVFFAHQLNRRIRLLAGSDDGEGLGADVSSQDRGR